MKNYSLNKLEIATCPVDLSIPCFFQLLTWTSLGKSVNSAGKSVFELVAKFYKRLYDGDTNQSHHTNASKFSQLFGTISLLGQNVSLSTLTVLLISRRSFQCCRPWADPGFFLGVGAPLRNYHFYGV